MTGLSAQRIEVLSAEDGDLGEPVPTIGGPVAGLQPVPEEHIAAATDGGLAAQLRAVGERLRRERTKDFDVPGTEFVLRAKALRDRAQFRKGLTTESFIVRCTDSLWLRDDDTGELVAIPSWGSTLAELLGIQAEKSSELVAAVFDNPVRLERFAERVVEWMAGEAQAEEVELGE